MPTLVLVRHGQSEWNLKNIFTGWRDPDITERGVAEARAAGAKLKQLGVNFDAAFTSSLRRAQHTLELILAELGTPELPTTRDAKLNERDYGDLNGMNKDEARAKFGEEQVHIWRRSYDVPPPGGESLADTAARVLPYFETVILPELRAGKNLIIAAHGNSLRALIMHLDQLSPEEIIKYELATGVPVVYELDVTGKVLGKQILD